MSVLEITDASGRQWKYTLSAQEICTIGRAPENKVVLNDPRASRHHAHVKFQNGEYVLVDGQFINGQLVRSANLIFINSAQQLEHTLRDKDQVTIGASALRFDAPNMEVAAAPKYDDKPLGHTQLLMSAQDVIQAALKKQPTVTEASKNADEELIALRRKAEILALFFEMSKTLSSVFSLEAIFDKATDIILRVTSADRVVALLTDVKVTTNDGESSNLEVISVRVRDQKHEARAKGMSISRTITSKVMRERQGLLSQDAGLEFASVNSIVSQGVRSTICAPLVVESGVHGALYADCLDAFKSFTRDDLELITAIGAQAAVAVENVRAHDRLQREEVARANYSRFMPDYVVKQILENPDSFKLGGVNQRLTVMFADIRGFTRLSESAPPEKVVQLLNRYFSRMSDVIFAHGGTLDKYIGDGLMALFGAPTATPEDACNAIACAAAMQQQMSHINEELREQELPEISIGIGLNTGEATVGYIGSERRSEYTAIGDTVNTSARLESNAKPGQILVSEETVKAAAATNCVMRPLPPISVKNKVNPVPIYEIIWQEHEARVTGESEVTVN
ncbi:MAG: adenylate/guanylate cyclase domain-containing protein [Pyrinomonadaceae bacterium]